MSVLATTGPQVSVIETASMTQEVLLPPVIPGTLPAKPKAIASPVVVTESAVQLKWIWAILLCGIVITEISVLRNQTTSEPARHLFNLAIVLMCAEAGLFTNLLFRGRIVFGE